MAIIIGSIAWINQEIFPWTRKESMPLKELKASSKGQDAGEASLRVERNESGETGGIRELGVYGYTLTQATLLRCQWRLEQMMRRLTPCNERMEGLVSEWRRHVRLYASFCTDVGCEVSGWRFVSFFESRQLRKGIGSLAQEPLGIV